MIQHYHVGGFNVPQANNDNAFSDDTAEFSLDEHILIKRMISGEHVTFENSGFNKDQWDSFSKRLEKTRQAQHR